MSEPLNAVIDISHHDGNVNLAKAKEDGILGVIQKATQGQSRPQESEQDDKWSFCLTAGTLCPANQEKQ